jgi:hypothetical protein
MKWQLVPEVREDMIRTAYRGGRGGHRGSSNPSSPNQLNYITQGPKDMARDPGSARKRKVSPSGSPQPRSSIRDANLTPVRGSRKPLPGEAGGPGADNTPPPRLRKSATAASAPGENAPASPTLTSAYLGDEGSSFITPAPHRVHPKLAPPSTAQRPSQHMPTSSPAPFWKYADIGSTPLKPAALDLSPSKDVKNRPASSSPPTAAAAGGKSSPAGSPSKTETGRDEKPEAAAAPISEPEEDGGFDLTRFVHPLLSTSHLSPFHDC